MTDCWRWNKKKKCYTLLYFVSSETPLISPHFVQNCFLSIKAIKSNLITSLCFLLYSPNVFVTKLDRLRLWHLFSSWHNDFFIWQVTPKKNLFLCFYSTFISVKTKIFDRKISQVKNKLRHVLNFTLKPRAISWTEQFAKSKRSEWNHCQQMLLNIVSLSPSVRNWAHIFGTLFTHEARPRETSKCMRFLSVKSLRGRNANFSVACVWDWH